MALALGLLTLAACGNQASTVDGLTSADRDDIQWLCALLNSEERSAERFEEAGVTPEEACACITTTFDEVTPGQRVDAMMAISAMREALGDTPTADQAEVYVSAIEDRRFSDETMTQEQFIELTQFRTIEDVFDQFESRLESGAACTWQSPR